MTASVLVEPAYRSAPEALNSLGDEVADLAAMAGFAPDPEQRMALDHLFAMKPDGRVAAMEFAVICSRQNLKTGLFKQAALGWLFVTEERLVVWSAHEFGTAQEAFRDMTTLIESCPMLDRRIKQIHRGNGDEAIELVNGSRLKFKARTKGGGRGLSGGKVVLDEAYALKPEHMGALLPLLSAQPDPQVVYGSSAGHAGSEVLRSVRDRGRRGGDPSLAYLEWCDDLPGECKNAPCMHELFAEGCRLDDQARWARANPAMGRRITMEYIANERRALPPAEFARERLGWWDEDPYKSGVFPPGMWENLADPGAERGDQPVFAVATAPDRSWSAVAVAWRRDDGHAQVMLADYRPTATWVSERVAELKARWGGIALTDTASRGLVDDAEEPSQAEQAKAHNALSDAVLAGAVRHGNEAAMNTAVRGAQWRPLGDTQVLDRKGGIDISPLAAAALAFHGLGTDQVPNIW